MKDPNILIVDDHYENRSLLLMALSPFSEKIDLASNGEDALEFFDIALEEEERYQLIFLDIMMPGINGLEVLDQIRQREHQFQIDGHGESQIYIITGDDSKRTVLRAFKHGKCTEYLVKPVDYTALVTDLITKGLIHARVN